MNDSAIYMRWIGHHDFGANFYPIRFGERISLDSRERLFWLHYWIDAYRFVLEHAPERTQFIGYESLLSHGAANLRQLASKLELNDAATATLTAAVTRLRAPTSRVDPVPNQSAHLVAEAEAVHSQLLARSAAQGYAGAPDFD